MRYLMFVSTDTEPDTDPNATPDVDAWFEDVNSRGRLVMGDRLRPREDATTVRVRSGLTPTIPLITAAHDKVDHRGT